MCHSYWLRMSVSKIVLSDSTVINLIAGLQMVGWVPLGGEGWNYVCPDLC